MTPGMPAKPSRGMQIGRAVTGLRYIPSRGERVEQRQCGIVRTGTVWYADQLQLLIKWDDGGSSSLRSGSEDLRLIEPEPTARVARTNGQEAQRRGGAEMRATSPPPLATRLREHPTRNGGGGI